jgi:starch synthase (maltosyl-transferring)
VIIEGLSPEVDGGRYPAKRVLGDIVKAECDLIADGHDVLAGRVLWRRAGEVSWQSAPLEPGMNDRWHASFPVTELGTWELCFEAWIDHYTTWERGTAKKKAAGQDVSVEMKMNVSKEPQHVTRSEVRRILVEPRLAQFSAWYELFPRSFGKLKDLPLDYVAELGFDILYLPPIHPIGRAFRKGPNNTLTAGPNDPGSPWAIGGPEGGHKAIQPELGTLDEFRDLVRRARAKKIEIALDIAFQVSPDHPYVKEHPEWFIHRPDGTIQYAENPPKKYQDVYPFDFESAAWESLWKELLSVFLFWIEQGVKAFRVDNPHTKSLRFWEWCIGEIKARHPEVIFLAEAFTRPKLMYALAKGGYSQSYSYFTWRHTRHEFQEYMRELVRVADFYRPNFWPNTPDILPEHLQHGGRATFLLRLILASTLSSNYGIYGPAFELMEHVARPGAEEYIDNEKYQLRKWNLDHPDSLRHVIARINKVRRETPALQQTRNIHFHETGNDALMCFSKREGDSMAVVIANMDPAHKHTGWIDLGERLQAHEVLSDTRQLWNGRTYVEIDPAVFPAQIYVMRKKVRTEEDFEYFL